MCQERERERKERCVVKISNMQCINIIYRILFRSMNTVHCKSGSGPPTHEDIAVRL